MNAAGPFSSRGLWLAIVAGLLALGLWVWRSGAERRDLAALSPSARRELYERNRAAAEATCREPSLRDQCREELEFLARFPECDAECQALVKRHTGVPTR
jgi:hypothetical protein